MKYLITATLLNNFSWFHKIASKTKEMEFKQNLKKESIVKNEYMEAGIEFEKNVKQWIELRSFDGLYNATTNYFWCVKEIARIVKDGTWQVKGYCDIQIGDIEFLLYGIADVLKGPYIYDIKFVQKYEYGKYQNSPQHKIYFRLFPGCTDFYYLIADGENVYTEHFGKDQTYSLTAEISDFWSWLNVNPEYMQIFQEKWEAL